MLFSTSSFTTEAGRSITSPAATWLASVSERRRTRLMFQQSLEFYLSIANEKLARQLVSRPMIAVEL
jgi:hypothetical protein